jgi:glutathione S-transferase
MSAGHRPTLYVCDGDDGGPGIHPCRRVQAALRDAGIEYEKMIAGPGRPFGIGMKKHRDQLDLDTGARKIPALKLPDGNVLYHSRAIMRWIKQQPAR